LTSCGDDDDDVLTDVTTPDNGNDNNQDSGDNGNSNEGSENGGIIDVNGHKAVDLGLSVKWATCNVGANSPEEYGGYYAWGETEEKDYYDWSTYKYCNGSSNSLTKYCTDSDYGTADNKTVLDSEDDVAHVQWGGSWRMPTLLEFKELSSSNCIWTWTSKNEVNGFIVTSKTNGNSIFLPVTGYRQGGNIYNSGSYGYGYFWSASLSMTKEYGSKDASCLLFYGGRRSVPHNTRSYGISVRPVTE
jgi:conserved domain protein